MAVPSGTLRLLYAAIYDKWEEDAYVAEPTLVAEACQRFGRSAAAASFVPPSWHNWTSQAPSPAPKRPQAESTAARGIIRKIVRKLIPQLLQDAAGADGGRTETDSHNLHWSFRGKRCFVVAAHKGMPWRVSARFLSATVAAVEASCQRGSQPTEASLRQMLVRHAPCAAHHTGPPRSAPARPPHCHVLPLARRPSLRRAAGF